MIKTITVMPKPIHAYFDKNLLSMRVNLGDTLENLHKIYLGIKIDSEKFRKYPQHYATWLALEKEYLELYVRTKAKEKIKGKQAQNKTKEPFYFIKMSNKSDENFFRRLRFKTTKTN